MNKTIKQAVQSLNLHLDDIGAPVTGVGVANKTLIIYSPKPAKITIERWQGYEVIIKKMGQPKP